MAATRRRQPSPSSNVEIVTHQLGRLRHHLRVPIQPASTFTHHTTRLCQFLWSRRPRTAQSNRIPAPADAFSIAAGRWLSHCVSLRLRRTWLLGSAPHYPMLTVYFLALASSRVYEVTPLTTNLEPATRLWGSRSKRLTCHLANALSICGP